MDTPDDPPRAAPRGDPTTAAQRVKKKANQEAHDAELREQKAAADQEVVQPFLDGLMGLPTMNPKAKGRAARFHPAEDVRWSAAQRLLDSLEERDPLLYRQVFLHMLGVSGNRTKPYGEISSRTTKGDRSTTLLKVLHTLACAQPLDGPRKREARVDVRLNVATPPGDGGPPKPVSQPFAVYTAAKMGAVMEGDSELSSEDAMIMLAEEWGKLSPREKAPFQRKARANAEEYQREREAHEERREAAAPEPVAPEEVDPATLTAEELDAMVALLSDTCAVRSLKNRRSRSWPAKAAATPCRCPSSRSAAE